jgi:hypothetical protein
VNAGPGGQRDEHLQAELFPFLRHQIGDAGLTDLEDLGRLGLCKSGDTILSSGLK